MDLLYIDIDGKWVPAIKSDGRLLILYGNTYDEDPWTQHQHRPIMQIPSFEDLRHMIDTLEWYADPTHYHPNGTPGSVIEEEGLQMWECDRGKRAKGAIERYGDPKKGGVGW